MPKKQRTDTFTDEHTDSIASAMHDESYPGSDFATNQFHTTVDNASAYASTKTKQKK